MNGSRSAATIGGRIAFRTAITAEATIAPPKPLTWTPGTIQAANSSASGGDEPREQDLRRLEAWALRLPGRQLAVGHCGSHRPILLAVSAPTRKATALR